MIKVKIKFRMHSGSTNAGKILLWISLHQQILHAVSDRQYTPTNEQKKWKKRKVIAPDNNICTRIAQLCIDGNTTTFQQRLKKRQETILERWHVIA